MSPPRAPPPLLVGGHPPGAGALRALQERHQPSVSQRGLRKRSGDGTEVDAPGRPPGWEALTPAARALSLYLAPLQMMECLKEQKKQLSQRCHQRIFRLQEVEMSDPELDYQLMRVCKQMIKVRKRKG